MRPPRVLPAFALAALWGCARQAAPPAEVRAIVVVDVDTLRADHLSTWGYARPTSPNLDVFAAHATRFEWAFAPAPYTLASQTSIFTSLMPSTHGVLRDGDLLGPGAPTLAGTMKAAGFTTAAFVDGGYLKPQFGLGQGFDAYSDLNGGGLRVGEAKIATWLREHRNERFFLLVHTYDVHTPYDPPEPFRSSFARLAPAPTPGFAPTSAALEAIRTSQWTPAPKHLAPNDLAYAEAMYDGGVAFVDGWFGRLLAELDELGLSAHTVVAFVSDHGEEFQEHGSVLHEKLYTTVTHVPLLVRLPGQKSARNLESPVGAIDLAPTLLALASIPVPGEMQGRSLAGLLGEAPGREEIVPAMSESPFFGEQRGIADAEFHLVLTLSTGKAELFRYRDDAAEMRDLAANEPAVVARLSAALRRRLAALPLRRYVVHSPNAVPRDVEENLRALGYVR